VNRACLALCSLLLAAGCAGAHKPSAQPIMPQALLPPSALAFDFQWRQRVRARWPTGQHSFDAVLQKRGDELSLVGLSPLGLPGFVLRLRGPSGVSVENRTGQPLPFEASYVLADVERVFFPWLPALPANDAHANERSGQRGDTHIVEHYQGGLLSARTFERPTARGLERVRVRYEGRRADRDAPAHAELENALLGYSLTIDTLEQTRLAAPPP
jgi:hypothetical protein